METNGFLFLLDIYLFSKRKKKSTIYKVLEDLFYSFEKSYFYIQCCCVSFCCCCYCCFSLNSVVDVQMIFCCHLFAVVVGVVMTVIGDGCDCVDVDVAMLYIAIFL